MDPETLLDLANQVTKLKMYPYFDLAHCAVCLLVVREDLGTGALAFSRKHPLSCWLSSMVVIFGCSLLANLMLGEPMLTPFKNNNMVLLATATWARKVHDGVTHAAKMFPNAYVVMIVIGVVKGNGMNLVRLAERLVRGVWTPDAIEFLRPAFATKASAAAALIFVLDKKTDLISAPHALVYFGIVIFFVYFKLSSLLLGIADPFLPFENLFSAMFLGGIMDSLQEMFYGKPKTEDTEEKKSD